MVTSIIGRVGRARIARVRGGWILISVVAVTSGVLATTASPGGAQPLPPCGSETAPPQAVPYTCELPGQTIDGTLVSAIVHADGTHVTVTYQLDAPRSQDTPIRIRHHEGLPGSGVGDTTRGTVPAGETTATLVGSSPCREGQLVVKFFFLTDGDTRGIVGNPWIRNGTGCTTTTPSPTATTTPSATSLPATSTSPTVTVAPLSTLPATGGDAVSPSAAAVIVLVTGVACLLLASRRKRDTVE